MSKTKKHCKFLVFEGPDKAGKSTQSKLAVEALQRADARVVHVKAPCKEAPRTYRLIYWMLGNGWAKRVPNVFQFVQFLNKLLFQVLVLPKLSRENDIIVFDRWSLSAVIYGNATGVNPTFNMWLYRLLKKADLTIVFAEQSYHRSTIQDDSYEKDGDLQSRVREAYKQWALTHFEDHVLVDNARHVDVVQREVQDRISTPCRVCGARIGEHCDAGLHS